MTTLVSVEQEHFYRHSTVIVDHVKNSYIKLLEHYLESQGPEGITLRKFITDNKHSIYHLHDINFPCCLCHPSTQRHRAGTKILHMSQMNILFGNICSSSSSSSCTKFCCAPVNTSLRLKHLDVTLANILLKLTNIVPYGSPERQALECLRETRNSSFAHAKKGRLSTNEYESSMGAIERNLMVLAKVYGEETEVQTAMNNVRNQPFNTQLYKELQRTLSSHQCQMNEISDQVEQTLTEIKKTEENNARQIGEMREQIGEFKAVLEVFISKLPSSLVNPDKTNRSLTCKIDTHRTNVDEKKTTKNLLRRSNRSKKKGRFAIEDCTQLCIFLNLSFTNEVLKSEKNLRSAIRTLLNDIIEAGEIDTTQPGEIKCSLCFSDPFTADELNILRSVFSSPGTKQEPQGDLIWTEIAFQDELLEEIKGVNPPSVKKEDDISIVCKEPGNLQQMADAKCEECQSKEKQINDNTEEIQNLQKEIQFLMEDNQLLRKDSSNERKRMAESDAAHSVIPSKSRKSQGADTLSKTPSKDPAHPFVRTPAKELQDKNTSKTHLEDERKRMAESDAAHSVIPSKSRKSQGADTISKTPSKDPAHPFVRTPAKELQDKNTSKTHLEGDDPNIVKLSDDWIKDIVKQGNNGAGKIDRGDGKMVSWSYVGKLIGFEWKYVATCVDAKTLLQCTVTKQSRTGALEHAMRGLLQKLNVNVEAGTSPKQVKGTCSTKSRLSFDDEKAKSKKMKTTY